MESTRSLSILLKMIDNEISGRFNRELERMELTASQMNVLMYLQGMEGEEVNHRDIERVFQLTNPTVTGILKRLEVKGFICRTSSRQDGRCKQILLTEKSRILKGDILRYSQELERKLVEGLGREEQKNLRQSLETVLENAKHV